MQPRVHESGKRYLELMVATVSEDALYDRVCMGPPPFLTAGCSSISHVACQLRGAMSCGILQAPEIAGVIYESWII